MLTPRPRGQDSCVGAARGTPFVHLDFQKVKRNIERMQQRADRHGVRLRPHVKTHKCIEIAELQIEAGASGLTVSKPDEAIAFIEAGFPAITVAYPVIDFGKLDRVMQAARENRTEVRFIADSQTGVETLAQVCGRHGTPTSVYLKIDVGLKRCGVECHSSELLSLARTISADPYLQLIGLMSHAGHSYSAGDAVELRKIAQDETAKLFNARRRLEQEGMSIGEISVGATPTALADAIEPGTTEIRPGNYVFLDLTPVRLGIASLDDVALTVVTSIVSKNDQFYIIDAGSKVMTSDLGAHGSGQTSCYGLALNDKAQPLEVVKLSEEHGFVARNATDLPIGEKLRIVPNHSCPVANLTDLLVVDKGTTQENWPVIARGKVQ